MIGSAAFDQLYIIAPLSTLEAFAATVDHCVLRRLSMPQLAPLTDALRCDMASRVPEWETRPPHTSSHPTDPHTYQRRCDSGVAYESALFSVVPKKAFDVIEFLHEGHVCLSCLHFAHAAPRRCKATSAQCRPS